MGVGGGEQAPRGSEMGSQPFLGQRAGCQGAGRGSCAPPPRVPRRPALPEPRAFRTGQGGGAELGRKVSPTPALAPATGIPAPPRGGKRGPGPGDRPGDRLRAAHVQAESACPGALGASSAARPHRRRGARRPQPASPESGLAGASSRGRAGTPVGAGAREKARGPEDRPAHTPEPRGRRPARLTPVSGPQPARSPLRLGAAAVQVKEGSSGLRVGPGPPHPSPLQPHWEDRFPQPPLVSGGDLSPTCPRGICPPVVLARLSSWVDTSQASRGAVMGLTATSAAPGDPQRLGTAPAPPGAPSVGPVHSSFGIIT
nr:translation initiation factor IF-2-like [Ovis aries]